MLMLVVDTVPASYPNSCIAPELNAHSAITGLKCDQILGLYPAVEKKACLICEFYSYLIVTEYPG